ncbi:MAG: hypothetical protein RL592_757 [Verrucomicrobiota bacterium]|jgi:hypothetical protein|nr:hypothetical protein [Verrucomicrobiota bacterium]
MITIKTTLAAVLVAAGLHAQLAAAPAKDEGHAADPEHARLVAARKAANDLPEVMSAEQQAKADRAMTNKAYAEYKAARKRSTDSEAAYRKAFDAALAKVDEGAPALQEKERAAFRERMLKARAAKKGGAKKGVAKADDDEDGDDEPSSPTKSSN